MASPIKIKMKLRERSYSIHIGDGLLEQFDFKVFRASTHVIITNAAVRERYGDALAQRLQQEGLAAEILEIPTGEEAKNMRIVEDIVRELTRREIDKNAILIALGGGVVGDITGFVASIYKRGIRYIQAPTTLLAQVDSSIGGKTGVNIPEGKNLIGTTYQPVAVLIDVQTLVHLPDVQIRNGLAEVIKYAVIKDEKFFRYLEQHIEERTGEFYTKIIQRSVKIKVSVVRKDEEEIGLRKILNYGHTIAHAIEILSEHTIPHGEAVAYGMMYEAEIAHALGFFDKTALERHNGLIKKLGFHLKMKVDAVAAIELMKHDKKSINHQACFVLPKRIGRMYMPGKNVSLAVEEKVIKKVLKNPPRA